MLAFSFLEKGIKKDRRKDRECKIEKDQGNFR